MSVDKELFIQLGISSWQQIERQCSRERTQDLSDQSRLKGNEFLLALGAQYKQKSSGLATLSVGHLSLFRQLLAW